MFKKCLLIALITLTTAACAQPGPVQQQLDDNYFIDLVAEKYARPFREGDIDTWLASFNEEAVALHNRRPIDKGKVAIEAFGRAVQTYFNVEQFDVRVTEVRQSPDWVYTVGQYTSHFVNKSDGVAPFGVEKGKFMLLWEKQADGEWQIILDTGNSNAP